MKTYTMGFVDPKTGKPTIITGAIPGKWIAHNGQKREPCDGYCRKEFDLGEWYFRQDQIGSLCETCADVMIGQKRTADVGPDVADCLHEPCTWSPDDCPFIGCVRR
jgi:hypothetical protein